MVEMTWSSKLYCAQGSILVVVVGIQPGIKDTRLLVGIQPGIKDTRVLVGIQPGIKDTRLLCSTKPFSIASS